MLLSYKPLEFNVEKLPLPGVVVKDLKNGKDIK